MMKIIPTTVLLVTQLHASSSFTAPSALNRRLPTTRATTSSTSSSPTALNGLFDNDTDASDNPTEIPPELRDEIYRAEANTPAAQGRNQRILMYALLTIAGITTAFANAFLGDLRYGDGAPSTDLAFYGFGWVQDNFLTSFMFLNKIGGGIGLLGAGLSGTLAEVEIRSKKENAEKIWSEMQTRRSLKEKPKKSNRKKNKRLLAQSSKKDMTGKQRRQMSALQELMDDDEPVVQQSSMEQEEASDIADTSGTTSVGETEPESKDNDDGIFGKIKGFYKQADSMAASQALLLNKDLEDRGMLEKITDETGLKVVGKDAASKLQDKKNEEN